MDEQDLAVLPPGDQRIFSGTLRKKVITSRGVKWQPRFAVLTSDHLFFAKQQERSSTSLVTHVAELRLSTNELWQIFAKFDANKNQSLESDEARRAIKHLELYTNEENFEILYRILDKDGDGNLDWEEFKELVKHSNNNNAVIDYIPLQEIEEIYFEINPKSRDAMSKTVEDFNKEGHLPAGGLKSEVDTGPEIRGQREPKSALKKVSSLRQMGASMKDAFENVTGLDVDGDGKAENLVIPSFNQDTHEVSLVLTTVDGGHNSGRVYVHVVSPSQAQAWIDNLQVAQGEAKYRHRKKQLEEIYGHSRLSMYRAKTKMLHQSNAFEAVISIFIAAGFLVDIAEAQVMAEAGSSQDIMFDIVDAIITTVFTIELIINLFANSDHGFKPFYSKFSNWFDGFIVIISVSNLLLASMGIELPNAKLLRLLRIARIIRLFSSLKDLQKIITACSSAVLPVCNAFLILLIIAAVYAILGTTFFHDRSPEYFRNFHTSLFTMFQVLSGDSWASGVARGIFQNGETDPSVAFFFITYILGCSVMMLNVVVAVLLDEFIASVTREKEEQARLEGLEREKRKISGCLDELTKSLVTFEDEEDLTAKIAQVYNKLDEDESGGLTFEEFKVAVKQIVDTIHLTRDDFDIITDNGKLLGPTSEFNAAQFQEMMKSELWRFSRREINNVLSVSGDDNLRSIVLLLKIMEMTLRSSLGDANRRLANVEELLADKAGGPAIERLGSSGRVGPRGHAAPALVVGNSLSGPSRLSSVASDREALISDEQDVSSAVRRVEDVAAGPRQLGQRQMVGVMEELRKLSNKMDRQTEAIEKRLAQLENRQVDAQAEQLASLRQTCQELASMGPVSGVGDRLQQTQPPHSMPADEDVELRKRAGWQLAGSQLRRMVSSSSNTEAVEASPRLDPDLQTQPREKRSGKWQGHEEQGLELSRWYHPVKQQQHSRAQTSKVNTDCRLLYREREGARDTASACAPEMRARWERAIGEP